VKVRITVDVDGRHIDQMLEAATPDQLLAEAKRQVERELGWKGLMIKALTPLQFAQLVARLYNEGEEMPYPAPQTSEEFIEFGQATGHLEVLEK
jgi:hypothetical protein